MKLFESDFDKLDISAFKKVIDSVGKGVALKNLIIADNYLIASNQRVMIYKPINIEGRYYVSPADFKKIKSIADLKKYMKPIMPELSGVNFLKIIELRVNELADWKIRFPKFIKKSEYSFWFNDYLYTKYDDWFVGREELVLNKNLPAFSFSNSILLFELFGEKDIIIRIPSITNNSIFSQMIEIEYEDYKCRLIISNISPLDLKKDWEMYYGDELRGLWS